MADATNRRAAAIQSLADADRSRKMTKLGEFGQGSKAANKPTTLNMDAKDANGMYYNDPVQWVPGAAGWVPVSQLMLDAKRKDEKKKGSKK